MADLIFYNGIVHTMADDAAETKVSAVAVSGNLIQAVGGDEEILKLAEENCRIINLHGKCLVPGFQDSHCHLLLTGQGFGYLDLRGVRSAEEMIEAGQAYIKEHQIPEGAWVLGDGFDHNRFSEPVLPDIRVVDAISTRHPILIQRVCGHVGTANTMAFQRVGFDAHTSFPGGVIDLDARGEITGVLREVALDQFKMRIPKPDVPALKEAIVDAARHVNQYGVTSVHTDDLEGGALEDILCAYHELEQEGRLNVRVWEEVQAARPEVLKRFLDRGLRTGDGSDYFKIGNIKLILDGSLGARTASLRADYSDDPGNRGIAVYTQPELNEVVLTAHKAGMQVACHAIGDRAVEQSVAAFEQAYRSDGKDLRNRVVHCQFADDELIRRMAASRIGADIQPGFVISDYPLTASRLGEREPWGYRWKSLLKAGVHMGAGSDGPVESYSPVLGIYHAVRRTDGEMMPEDGWHPEEKLTAKEGLYLYTRGGSYLSFEEDRKGQVKAGFLADLAVLSADILDVPDERIRDIQVEMTVLGGRIVYHRQDPLAWEEISTEHIVQDEWIDFRKSAYRFPDGRIYEPFYTYSRKDYVVIVASDENGNYLCVRQFRQGIKAVTTEFPAGGIEQKDDRKCGKARKYGKPDDLSMANALAAAKRELLEETGYESNEWRHLLTVPSNATISDNYVHLFAAENCRKKAGQSLDETEFLNVIKHTAQEIENLIANGMFQQADHILAWLLARGK